MEGYVQKARDWPIVSAGSRHARLAYSQKGDPWYNEGVVGIKGAVYGRFAVTYEVCPTETLTGDGIAEAVTNGVVASW